jgi:hypothetical protein
MEIQRATADGSESQKVNRVRELLYPDHLIFEVGTTRGNYRLKPFSQGQTEEALVIPRELAGIVAGSAAY